MTKERLYLYDTTLRDGQHSLVLLCLVHQMLELGPEVWFEANVIFKDDHLLVVVLQYLCAKQY